MVVVAEIAVERESVNIVVALLEHLAVPLEVSGHTRATGPAGNQLERRIHVAHLAGGVGGLEAIFLGRHVPDLPGAIHFVAQAPVAHFVGIGNSVLAAQIAPASSLLHVAILDERGGFFGRSGPQIQAHERFGAGGFTPGKKFVGSELVRLGGVPSFVENARPTLFWTDAVEPVIAGNKITSRITNDRNTQLADFAEHVLAKTVGVGEFRPGLVDAFVDGASEMFEKRPEQVAIKRRDGPPGIDVNAGGCVGCG